MKAISLWQPWAQLLVMGAKINETRHWTSNVYGRIAIHAAKKWDRELKETCEDLHFRNYINPDKLAFGAIVGTAELIDYRRVEEIREKLTSQEHAFGNYADKRYAWVFREPIMLETPIPYKGAQGWFEFPDELIEVRK